MRLTRLSAALFVAASLRACTAYEYDHEFWLGVDGSGSVRVTGRPELWGAFKGLSPAGASEASIREAARTLFEASGLRVRRVALTRRGGRPYLLVVADFADVSKIGGTPAFPDLRISLVRRDDRLVLGGSWARPPGAPLPGALETDGLVAIRFHLPSKIRDHKNATLGVERGNIVGWRQELTVALEGRPLDFGAVLDPRSILWSTVELFGAAILGALALLTLFFTVVVRRGRRGVSGS